MTAHAVDPIQVHQDHVQVLTQEAEAEIDTTEEIAADVMIEIDAIVIDIEDAAEVHAHQAIQEVHQEAVIEEEVDQEAEIEMINVAEVQVTTREVEVLQRITADREVSQTVQEDLDLLQTRSKEM